MNDQLSMLRQPGRPRRRTLAGPALAAGLVLAGILACGGSVTHATAAEDAASPIAHTQMIARVAIDLADEPLAWTVTTIDAGRRATSVVNSGDSGFLVGIEGVVVIRDDAKVRSRLAEGEALAVRPEDALTVQAANTDPASVSLLTLGPVEADPDAEAPGSEETFASPAGKHEVELLHTELAEKEASEFEGGDAPTFVLVTDGSITIEPDDGERQSLEAGDTALVTGGFGVSGAAEEPSRFVAAVIGPEAEAAAAATATARGQSGPQPTAPARPTTAPSNPTEVPPTPTSYGDGPADDPDGDGLVNSEEDAVGTGRRIPDTDGDLLIDGEEVHNFLTQPLVPDTDGDDLLDGEEVIAVGSNPAVADTDGDGLNDGAEVAIATLTTLIDTDGDRLTDAEEFYIYGTYPTYGDTDGDGAWDGDEVVDYGTNPLIYDTDGDGASDGDEVLIYGTNPMHPDSDDDGLKDPEEIFLLTNPLNPDTDGDGYGDGAEVYTYHTSPLDAADHP